METDPLLWIEPVGLVVAGLLVGLAIGNKSARGYLLGAAGTVLAFLGIRRLFFKPSESDSSASVESGGALRPEPLENPSSSIEDSTQDELDEIDALDNGDLSDLASDYESRTTGRD